MGEEQRRRQGVGELAALEAAAREERRLGTSLRRAEERAAAEAQRAEGAERRAGLEAEGHARAEAEAGAATARAMQLSTALQRVEAAKQAAREDASHAARQSRSLRSALDAARAEASEAREALDAQRRAERSLARSLYSELEEQVILTMAVGRASFGSLLWELKELEELPRAPSTYPLRTVPPLLTLLPLPHARCVCPKRRRPAHTRCSDN